MDSYFQRILAQKGIDISELTMGGSGLRSGMVEGAGR
jgi:hypothetical protein